MHAQSLCAAHWLLHPYGLDFGVFGVNGTGLSRCETGVGSWVQAIAVCQYVGLAREARFGSRASCACAGGLCM